MAAFFGMATMYAEGLLAIKYRTKDDHGAVAGGPMHYILLGMGEKWRPFNNLLWRSLYLALSCCLCAHGLTRWIHRARYGLGHCGYC